MIIFEKSMFFKFSFQGWEFWRSFFFEINRGTFWLFIDFSRFWNQLQNEDKIIQGSNIGWYLSRYWVDIESNPGFLNPEKSYVSWLRFKCNLNTDFHDFLFWNDHFLRVLRLEIGFFCNRYFFFEKKNLKHSPP